MKTSLIRLMGLLVFLPLAAGAEDVAIVQGRPIEKLDANGRPSGVAMAQVGATYTVVAPAGGQLELKDAAGNHYLIAATATSYTAPATPAAAPAAATGNPVPTVSVASTKAAPVTEAPTPASSNADSPSTASPPPAPAKNLSKEDADQIKQINDAVGLPLLASTQFWQEDVADVAHRLDWPKESETSTQKSYRRYAESGQVNILGALAYSMALYGKEGKPTYLSIIFSNAGDFAEARKLSSDPLPDQKDKVMKDLAVAVKKDSDAITAALTPILGDPVSTLYGNASSNREEVHRWDWKDVAILLNSHNGEYTSLKIIPTEVADHHGTVDVTDRDGMRDLLAARVVKRDNGDVVLSEIPMVDQGPKGYCVPATWERYLRYMDVPADLYVLAIMGQTGLGGGTNPALMEAGVDDYVSAYHRRIETYEAPLDVSHIARYIDQGLPLMWTCWIVKPVEIQTSLHSRERKTVTDWSAYADHLRADDALLGQFDPANDDRSNGHMRLIIGYNATTNEIAISDSWGPVAAERWMYAGTALKISQGQLGYLSW